MTKNEMAWWLKSCLAESWNIYTDNTNNGDLLASTVTFNFIASADPELALA